MACNESNLTDENDIIAQGLVDTSQSNLLVLDVMRTPTEVEKDLLSYHFPNLDVDNTIVTGECDDTYNCIANAMGLQNQWINPASTLASFILQFQHAHSLYGASWNYNNVAAKASVAIVDGYGLSASTMTHASRRASNRWESKLGEFIRILHDRFEVTGYTLGNIVVSFVIGNNYDSNPLILSNVIDQDSIVLTESDCFRIRRIASKVDDNIRSQFENLYGKWKEDISTNMEFRLSSDSRTWTRSEHFKQMEQMGTAIIPLILEKMLNEKEFHIVLLYNKIQDNKELVTDVSNGEMEILESQQQKAKRAIKLYLEYSDRVSE